MTHAARIRSHATPLDPLPTRTEARLKPLDGIEAVAFDIYGTLIISGSGDIGLIDETSRESAMDASFAALGVNPAPGDWSARFYELVHEAQAARRAEGIEYPEVEIREVWQKLCGEAGVAVEVEAGVEALAIEYECRTNPVWPMPHLAETLTALQERGIPLGIVSNAQFYTPWLFEAFLERSLADLGFAPHHQVYSFALREGKPSTALYQELARQLNPTTTLYVGNDMLKDIWPAQAVGFRTALFAADQRSLRQREDDSRVEGVEPDLIVTDLIQVLDVV